MRTQHLYLLQCGYNAPLKFLMGLCSEKTNIRIGTCNQNFYWPVYVTMSCMQQLQTLALQPAV